MKIGKKLFRPSSPLVVVLFFFHSCESNLFLCVRYYYVDTRTYCALFLVSLSEFFFSFFRSTFDRATAVTAASESTTSGNLLNEIRFSGVNSDDSFVLRLR